MKYRLITLLILATLVVGLFGMPGAVEAASYGTAFVTSIVYMNVGTGSADVSFQFYSAGSSTPINYPSSGTLSIGQYAAGSLYAGAVFTSSFQGSVAISSTQALAVIGVQTPPLSSPVKVRMLSNGFTSGSSTMIIPTVRRTPDQDSVFSIQNADSVGADVTVAFYAAGNPVAVATDHITNLPAGSAKFYDMGTSITTTSGSIPSNFNGSATVTAVQTGTSSPGSIVASSQEFDLGATSYKAYAFNGVSSGATKAYMPSAFCNYSDPPATTGPVTSYYALTNASDQNVDITVTYASGVSQQFLNVAPGNKVSPNGCATASAGSSPATPGPNANGYSGSATITAAWTSTPGTGNPSVVAIGKIVGLGYSTAFEGVPDPAPASVALPYVRFQASSSSTWLDGSRQQVYIAVQNVGTTTLAAGSISVKFYDINGVQVGATQTNSSPVAVNAKAGFNAGSVSPNFGYWPSGAGGGAIITGPAGSHLAVLARAQTWDPSAGFKWSEDYIGIPMQ